MLTAGQKTMNKFYSFWKKIWSKSRECVSFLLFPTRCVVCDEVLEPEQATKGIHIHCERELVPISGAVCMHCGRPFRKYLRKNPKCEDIYFDNSVKEYCQECVKRGYIQKGSVIAMGRALYLYKGVMKKSMYRLKYSNRQEYAAYFARRAKERYPWLLEVDVIIPVPMYRKKKRKRGYNQAEVFAKALSALSGVPVAEDLIFRVKDTIPQKELNDLERKNNLKNAFQIRKNIVKYKRVLVVDDIYTTGATVEAVAEELKYIGICQVYVLCICHGGEL